MVHRQPVSIQDEAVPQQRDRDTAQVIPLHAPARERRAEQQQGRTGAAGQRREVVPDEHGDRIEAEVVALPGVSGAGRREVVPVAGDERLPVTARRALDFVRARLTGDYEVDEFGFDSQLTDAVVLPALRVLYEKWFRVSVKGTEHLPTVGGALVVCNHSGTVPLDGLMTSVAVHDEMGRNLRLLGANLLFGLPFIGELARKAGHTLACHDDAERLLTGGELVGVFPEGFKGIGKSFGSRYKLQRFGRGGFVTAAVKAGVPIVPCAIVGAEEAYPKIGDLKPLARLLGLPYFPVTPFFPLLGPLGAIPLPTKWSIEFGEPIRTDLVDTDSDDPMLALSITDRVREAIQHNLYDRLRERDGVFSG